MCVHDEALYKSMFTFTFTFTVDLETHYRCITLTVLLLARYYRGITALFSVFSHSPRFLSPTNARSVETVSRSYMKL